MGLMQRLIGGEPEATSADYVDLTEHRVTDEDRQAATCLVKVAEIARFDDVLELADEVYAGHMLLLDIRAVQGDEFALRRITNELRRMVGDVGGDLAGVRDGLLCVTPAGIRVDRQKLRFDA